MLFHNSTVMMWRTFEIGQKWFLKYGEKFSDGGGQFLASLGGMGHGVR